MVRLLKYLSYVAVLCAVIVAGYALIFDLPAPQAETSVPVVIEFEG